MGFESCLSGSQSKLHVGRDGEFVFFIADSQLLVHTLAHSWHQIRVCKQEKLYQ